MMDGCCQDKNTVLRLSTDFSLKHAVDYSFINTFTNLFFISLPFGRKELPLVLESTNLKKEFPPPKLQNNLLISTSVLKI